MIGSIGLALFALVNWRLIQNHQAWWVILVATIIWAVVCAALWWCWKNYRPRRFARHT